MAYRRRQQQEQQQQQQQHSSRRPSPISVGEDDQESPTSSSSSSSSLAAKAIRASSAGMESSLSSAYSPRSYAPSSAKNLRSSEYVANRNSTEQKQGFWGALARKAKSIIDDNDVTQPSEPSGRADSQLPDKTAKNMERNPSQLHGSQPKPESATIQKGLGAIASSLNYIGGTIGTAVEEGLTIVENRTVEIIHETRKHMKKKPGRSEENDKKYSQQDTSQSKNDSHVQTEQEIQLKASRDVAMAMAAKAKLLLRELKTVKADLAFAKERCAQLEDENKILRDNRERGSSPDDDDLIRLQLETLLAEKARLAHENSVYARENRFLREVVEYHQLTMQDVIYLDEASEEVNEVYPSKVPLVSNSNSSSSAVASASTGVYPVSPETPSGIVYRT